MRERVVFSFAGRFRPESFAEFVAHRAAKLALAAEIRSASPSCIAVTVEGEGALIDAFEMACSLGPIDCHVLDYWREDDKPETGVRLQ
jgi:hypothetical protein